MVDFSSIGGVSVQPDKPFDFSSIGGRSVGNSVASNAERIEPGVYGDTNPTGQKILENLGTVAAGGGIGELASAGMVKALGSDLGRAVLNSPKAIGNEMSAGLEDAGVVRRPPELGASAKFEDPYSYASNLANPKGGRIPRLKPQIPAEPLPTTVPIRYPEDPATLHNFAKARIDKFGSDLTPQELTDYKNILSDSLTEMNAKGMANTPLFSHLADLQSNVTDLHNAAIPGRADLNKIYALSTAIRNIPGRVVSGAKTIGKVGALTGAVGYGVNRLLNQ